MKGKLIFPLVLVLILSSLTLVVQASRQSAGIGVQNADRVFETAVGITSGWESILSAIEKDCVVRSSDGVTCLELETVSGDLQTLLDLIPTTKFIVVSANRSFPASLIDIPSDLDTLVSKIPNTKFTVVSANGSLPARLLYPTDLIGDNLPPQIINVQINSTGDFVTWDTNEYSDSETRYGTKVDDLSQSASDSRLVISHQLTLGGVTSGENYYYLIRSTDRSGNTGEYFYPGFSASGSAVDTEGDPIPGVVISASATQITTTDEGGKFDLRGLATGSHTLTALHNNYTFEPANVDITVGPNATGIKFIGTLTIRFIYLPTISR